MTRRQCRSLMKTYLIMGILCVGWACGEDLHRCPNSRPEPWNLVGLILVWPTAMISAVVVLAVYGDHPAPITCD